jgi:hypothetical protein
MALKYIGRVRNKKVFLTVPHGVEMFEARNLTNKEALEIIKNPHITYPIHGGRQKVRGLTQDKKFVFLTIKETVDKIVVITGGEK